MITQSPTGGGDIDARRYWLRATRMTALHGWAVDAPIVGPASGLAYAYYVHASWMATIRPDEDSDGRPVWTRWRISIVEMPDLRLVPLDDVRDVVFDDAEAAFGAALAALVDLSHRAF